MFYHFPGSRFVRIFSFFAVTTFIIFVFFHNRETLAQSSGNTCHLLISSSAIPSGYGAPYDVLSPVRDLLIRTSCTSSSATVQLGKGDALQYNYHQGYIYTPTATDWAVIDYTSTEQKISNAWYPKTASITVPLTQSELSRTNWVLGYICTWTGTQWKCGCRDTACAQSYWQLQQFTSPSASPQTFEISPSSTVIGISESGKLYATYDPDGPAGPQLVQYLSGPSVAWMSSNSAVATVDSQGNIIGTSSGSVTVTAVYQARTATAQIKVAGTVMSSSFVTQSGKSRSYLLYVPQANNPSAATPLVFVFHGGGGSGKGIMNTSQMNAVADQQNFVVAYPDGTSSLLGANTWNGGSCCGYAVTSKAKDVDFIRELLVKIKQSYSIDDARVYATGISNGGILSHRLGCDLSDKIAAIAPVDGGINLGGDFPSCNPSRHVPIMEFHGTTDDNYPYNGGVGEGYSGVDFYSIPNTITDWLGRNGVSANTKTITYQKGIETCETYASSADGEVTLCTANPPANIKVNGVVYDGGGHAWPGGLKGDGPDADIPTMDLSASEAMWTFFMNHPKR